MIGPMARAIVRYSINGESSNITGNAARGALWEHGGFERSGTASFDADGPQEDLVTALRALLEVLDEMPGGGTLDHLWIYLDEPEGPPR